VILINSEMIQTQCLPLRICRPGGESRLVNQQILASGALGKLLLLPGGWGVVGEALEEEPFAMGLMQEVNKGGGCITSTVALGGGTVSVEARRQGAGCVQENTSRSGWQVPRTGVLSGGFGARCHRKNFSPECPEPPGVG
jgi:hypothetical protein